MENNFNKFTDILSEAQQGMLQDNNLFNKKTPHINHIKYKKQLEFLTQEYYNEIRNLKLGNISRLDNMGSKNDVIMNLYRKNFDLFIIMPISDGATEKEIFYSQLSLVNNLSFLNYCLIFVINCDYKDFSLLESRNINYVILKNCPKLSLPASYNLAVNFIIDNFNDDALIGFMDEDAYIMGEQQSIIRDNIKLLKDKKALAVSGHCYDTRDLPGIFFQSILVSNEYKMSAKILKPYCHGGALMLMDLKNYPEEGLLDDGLGGMSFKFHVLSWPFLYYNI